MQHLLSEEQVMFGDAVGRFVETEYAGARTGRRELDRERMRRLADLGAFSLAIPEELGGYGGAVETMVLHERLAPTLAAEPVLSTGTHAAALISAAARPAIAERLLPRIAAGEMIASVAHLEPGMAAHSIQPATMLRRDGDELCLTGRKVLVPCAIEADVFLISACEEVSGRMTWVMVPKATVGLTVSPAHRIDALPAGDLELNDCRVQSDALLDRVEGAAALNEADDRTEVAQVAEMVGLMSALIAATTEYVSTRRQFGVSLGSFQALRHRIADMWMDCEESRVLAFAAALACAKDPETRAEAVSIAKLRACDTADRVGAEAIQLHGAIGMTDELIVSHWYKRLWALKLSLGDRSAHLDRLADPARDFALT